MKEEKTDIKFSVELFTPAAAEGVRDLFLAVYGKEYPIKTYYNPTELKTACEKKDIILFVAKIDNGKVVGCAAAFRSAPFEHLYEMGSGIVLTEYRKAGISTALNAAICMNPENLKSLNVESLWGEAVANHVGMQKIGVKIGFFETGIEVDLMPAEAYDQEKSAQGRVSSVVTFTTLKSSPHTVFLPPVYEKELRYLYEGFDDPRPLELSDASLPEVTTDLCPQIYSFAKVARIAIERAGKDFADSFEDLEKKLVSENRLEVIQVWVKLSDPANHAVIEELRNRGYFIGGLLPRWFDQDGMLMQKILIAPNWDGMVLFSDRAKKIRDLIRADWEINN